MMACEQAIMDQADAYRAALTRARNYVMTGGELILFADGRDPIAVFVQEAQELAGTDWVVSSYNNGRDAVVSVLADTTLTLQFGSEGEVTGSAGCNNLRSSYQTSNGQLRLTPVATTRRLCAEPPGIMEQEAEFLGALESATTYSIEEGSLVPRTREGTLALTARPR